MHVDLEATLRDIAPRLLRYCAGSLRDASLGEEIAQESLAALVKADVVTKDGRRYALVDSLFREWVARKTY